MARSLPVTGSKGLALGNAGCPCKASEGEGIFFIDRPKGQPKGNGDRVPVACGGVWGLLALSYAARFERRAAIVLIV